MQNMRTQSIYLALLTAWLFNLPAFAQKTTIFAEAGLGFGQTLFGAGMDAQLRAAYGGSFSPNVGNNLHMAFYAAPQNWKGFGLGSRIKGTFGSSVKGDLGDDYIFNYYNLSVSAKYFLLSRQFNQGFYLRGSYGFGQMTTKRLNEAENRFAHQYAIGGTSTISLGYVIPLKNGKGIGIEAEYERSRRNGTINGLGDSQVFRSAQLGGNFYFSF
jgi:hypothetical protein